MLRIHVWNLAAYNAGRLIGNWIHLAKYSSAEELQKAINETIRDPLSERDSDNEEWIIGDYDCYAAGVSIGEYETTDRVWEIYEKLCEHDDPEAFGAYVAVTGDFDEACENFEDAYRGRAESLEDYAEHVMFEQGTPFVNSDAPHAKAVSWEDLLDFLSKVGFFAPQVDTIAWSQDHTCHNGYVFADI